MPRILFAGAAVVLAACTSMHEAPRASNPRTAASEPAPAAPGHCRPTEDGQPSDCGWIEDPDHAATICREERTTGTSITRTVCRSPSDVNDEDAARQSWINHHPANPMLGDRTYPVLDPRR